MNQPALQRLLSGPAVFAVTLLSRIPFLFDGYGVEEDSWGLVVNAYTMKATGHYTASRFPGHPLQEYLYRLIYDQPAWVYNSFSALFSAAGAWLFFAILKKLNPQAAFAGALALAFTPVVYIAGVCTIDYAWTLAFVLGALLLLLQGRIAWAGVCIGFAAGCRITTGVFLLPFAFLLLDTTNLRETLRRWLLLGVPAAVIGVLFYVPVYLQYGAAFFDYSDQFPYPPLAKIAYKASIGVFGLIGLLAVAVGFAAGLANWRKRRIAEPVIFPAQRILWMCIIVLALHVVSYLRLPQKSAYFMPAVPFLLLFLALTLNRRFFSSVSAALVLSAFVCSINLTDPLRGSESSASALKFRVAGQEIFFDPFSGPVFSERSKRLNKLSYCAGVLQRTDTLSRKSVIISGWWYNELLTEHLHGRPQNPRVAYRFYCTQKEMQDSIAHGWTIFYLPEQDRYNDEMFGQQGTGKVARPF